MKYIIPVLLISVNVTADCFTNKQPEVITEGNKVERVNTPYKLKDATITVTTKDGKVYTFKSDEYMVAKRLKTTQVVTKNTLEITTCVSKKDEEKNLLMLGARHDHTDVSVRSDGKTAIVSSEKDVVLDLGYYRKKIIKNVGAGVGIDTNGTPKGMLGVEF